MKRQRGRNRGGNGGQGGGKPQQHNVNRSFESGGPDNVKIRGNAQHVYEKYQQLARDASSSGDRVLAENYLQHAEHYFRVIRAVQPNKPLTDIIGRDTFSGYDIDFEDESGAQAYAVEGVGEGEAASAEAGGAEGDPSQQPRQDRGEWQPRDRQQNDRQQNDRQQNDRQQNDQQRQQRDGQQRDYNRDDRPRDNQQRDYQRDDRPRDNQQQDRYRDDRARDGQPRDNQQRDNQPRDNQQPRDGQQGDRPPRRDRFGRERYNRDDRPNRDPMAVVEPEATPLTPYSEAPPATEERQLRSQDGSLSPAPAFLQAAAPRAVETAEDGEVRKPRRRRAPKTFEGGDEAASAPETEEA